jgi:hypothetical protein
MPEWLKAKFVGAITLFFGLLSWPALLHWLISDVNCASFLLGFGEKVTVTVQTSQTRGYKRAIPGSGYYERDGERVQVRIWDVQAGEKVSTTLPLIPWKVRGLYTGPPSVYVKGYRAVTDLIFGLILTLVFLVMAVACPLAGIMFLWVRME